MKNKVVGILISVLILLSLEGLSRLFYKGNYLDKIKEILREDSSLLWTQKPRLDTVFEGVGLKTNSLGFRNGEIGEKKKRRIVVMGASPSFGWGVELEKTYPVILEKKLVSDGAEAGIINASVIGYSSWQGKRLLEKEIIKLKPDAVVFAYGVNDVDKHRFFGGDGTPDSRLRLRTEFSVSLSNFLSRSYFVRAYTAFLLKLLPSGKSFYRGENRVSSKEFVENADFFYQASLRHGFKLVLVTPPFYKPPSYAKAACGKDDLDFLSSAAAGASFDAERLKKIEDKKNLCTEALYLLSGLQKNKKEYWNRKLLEAQLYEAYEDILLYEKALKKYAAGKPGISLADAAGVFRNSSGEKALFLNPEHDFVHFSEAGNLEIADLLYRALDK